MNESFQLAEVDETRWELGETRFSDLAEDLNRINISIWFKVEALDEPNKSRFSSIMTTLNACAASIQRIPDDASIVGRHTSMLKNRSVCLVKIARDVEHHAVEMLTRKPVSKKLWRSKPIDTDTEWIKAQHKGILNLQEHMERDILKIDIVESVFQHHRTLAEASLCPPPATRIPEFL